MNHKTQHFVTSGRGWVGGGVLILALLLSALACDFQVQRNDDLKQTDIALAIMQTRVGETATALAAQASWTAVPSATPLPPTPQPVVPTDPPAEATLQPVSLPATDTPAPSADGGAILLTDWKLYGFTKLSNGCREMPDLNCWMSKMSGSGSWKTGQATESSLTARTPILVEESWQNPYLIYDWDLDSSGFTAYLELKIGSDRLTVKRYEKGSTGWATQVIDLSPYKGKEITIIFKADLTHFLRTTIMKLDWRLQNIRIEPNYQP